MLSDLDDLPAIKLTETDYLRFEVDSLTDYGREVALKELRETDELREKSMVELRNALLRKFLQKKKVFNSKKNYKKIIINLTVCFFSEDTDLYLPTDNDDWVVRFLRPCKFYPDSARKLVCIFV